MQREQAPRNDVRANSSEATPIFDELLELCPRPELVAARVGEVQAPPTRKLVRPLHYLPTR